MRSASLPLANAADVGCLPVCCGATDPLLLSRRLRTPGAGGAKDYARVRIKIPTCFTPPPSPSDPPPESLNSAPEATSRREPARARSAPVIEYRVACPRGLGCVKFSICPLFSSNWGYLLFGFVLHGSFRSPGSLPARSLIKFLTDRDPRVFSIFIRWRSCDGS